MDTVGSTTSRWVTARRIIGASILVGGVLVLAYDIWLRLWDPASPVRDAFFGGMLAAGATTLGAVPVMFSQRISERTQDALFGFGAGVMLAASAFSLIAPGIAAAQAQGATPWAASLTVGAAVLLGGAVLLSLDRALPHEHFIKGVEGKASRRLRRVWLFVFAIALHNFPEGLAIGVAYAGTDVARATALTTGIAVQDVPEGLVVALALLSVGYSRLRAVLLAMATGLVEPVGAMLGASIVEYSAALLPWGLGVAAGAMLFVISHEIIPESHRKGHEVLATVGLMIGFVLMMVLDTALG